jgi:hypothetical protein
LGRNVLRAATRLAIHGRLLELRDEVYAHTDRTGGRDIIDAGALLGEPGTFAEQWRPLSREALPRIIELAAHQQSRFPGRVITSMGIRSNLGGGTEDEAYVIARDEVFVSGNAPRFFVHESVGSNTLTVRFQAMQYLATMFNRRPKAIARISGTGMVAPTL